MTATPNTEIEYHLPGPRTEEGKQRSSQNSLTHGVFARKIVLPGESQEEFDALHKGYVEEYKPMQPSELDMVKRLVETEWRMRRLRRVEAAAMEEAIEKGDLECKFLLLYSLYEQRLNRQFLATQKALRELKLPRAEERHKNLETAITLRQYTKDKGIAWDPAAEGFVFSTEYLDEVIAARATFEVARNHAFDKKNHGRGRIR